MKKTIKFSLASVAIILGLGFTGCGSENATDESDTVETLADSNATGSFAATSNPSAQSSAAGADSGEIVSGPATTISFDEPVYDFGTRKTGEFVEHVYKFKNTGSEPLVITNAKGSCGCTVPQWPKEPIPAGGEGEIKVKFDGKGKTGPQSKNVSITANTNPSTTILTIKGNLEGTPEAAQ